VHDGAVLHEIRADRRRTSVAVGLGLALAIGGSVVAAWVDSSVVAYRGSEVVTALVISVTAVVGAVVALSVPGNRIGWLVLAGAVLSGSGEAMTELGIRGELTHPGSVPASAWLVMLGVTARTLSWTVAFVAVPALFPDGRLPDPAWRWLRTLILAALAVQTLACLLAPIETRLGNDWRGPLTPVDPANTALGAINLLGTVLALAAAVGAVAGLVRRWRRGDPVERQQLLLFIVAVAAVTAFLAFVLVDVVVSPASPPRWVFSLSGLPVPLAIAAATLTHGLYDLRRAANRALLALLLTVSTAAVYVVIVVVATALAPDRQALWPSALAALGAALVLIPLRERLQRVVARVVYGRWDQPYELLSGLGQRLAAVADLDQLLAEVVSDLEAELDLTSVSVRDARGALVAGTADRGAMAVSLAAYGVPVGTLAFDSADRELSPAELRLVRDLAQPLGDALHVRGLLADLQATRERLVLSREEERRRLRRDLHDGIGPALAGLTLKAEAARSLLPPDATAASAQLASLVEEIRATVVDVRRVVEGLRPPSLDELGLVGACTQAVARLTGGTAVHASVEAEPLPPLPAALEVAAFRIVQEAATNVVRHAGATQMLVGLRSDGAVLEVSVRDDGAGRDGRGDGNGMSTMRERAEELGGRLYVDSPGSGLLVRAELPLDPSAARAQLWEATL